MSDTSLGDALPGPGDGPSGMPRPEPDFLDRLLARHTAPRRDAARVRPRLPGPFERVEAVRPRTPDPEDADALLWPSATPSAVRETDASQPPAPGIHQHTERERTVVRTGPAPAQPAPRPVPPALPEAPLLRPALPFAAGPRPVSPAGSRPAGRPHPGPGADLSAASVARPPGTDAATPAAVSGSPLPPAADTAAARDAVRQSAARRAARAPEQVVQVSIGRLEVTAGQPASPGRGSRQQARGGARPEASLSLGQYLAAREEPRN